MGYRRVCHVPTVLVGLVTLMTGKNVRRGIAHCFPTVFESIELRTVCLCEAGVLTGGGGGAKGLNRAIEGAMFVRSPNGRDIIAAFR